jgi:hypothetical protein
MSQLNVDTIKNRLGTAGPTVPSLTVTNGINVVGVVTATSFVGSGSGLTGVGLGSTGSINTSGIITATSFVGNGSGLTGVAATTLTIGAGTTALPSISPTGDSNTGIFFPAADTIAVSAGGTERVRVDSSGRLLIGISTSGNANGGILQLSGGITFPATAVAATDVNTLDDYEEGTHTATLTPSTSGSITLNASYQTLTYTKVGRLVSIRGTLIASSSSSPVGYVTVSLPFTPAAVVGLGYAGGSVFVDGATGVNANQFVLAIFTSGARIYLGDSTGLQSDSAQAIASSGQVYLEMNYHV